MKAGTKANNGTVAAPASTSTSNGDKPAAMSSADAANTRMCAARRPRPSRCPWTTSGWAICTPMAMLKPKVAGKMPRMAALTTGLSRIMAKPAVISTVMAALGSRSPPMAIVSPGHPRNS